MMTSRQLTLARHALGLGKGNTVSYRRHFVAGPGHADYAEWIVMETAGNATRREAIWAPKGEVMFLITRKGAEQTLRPGESLSVKDFP